MVAIHRTQEMKTASTGEAWRSRGSQGSSFLWFRRFQKEFKWQLLLH